MKDVSKAADERAAYPSDAPVGSSFETDRQRQKASVGRQFDALDGTRIRKIAAQSETEKSPTSCGLRTVQT